jgi:hypothetical protein
MPTTAAQPYFHQPSVTPISTGDARQPAGSTLSCRPRVWRSNTVVLGMETTRTAIFCGQQLLRLQRQLHFGAGGDDHRLRGLVQADLARLGQHIGALG